MFQALSNALFPSVPATFRSDHSIDESVRRLSEAVQPSVFHSPFKERAAGPVRRDFVRLQRVTPHFRNSFKPNFVGAFHVDAEGVVLAGAFTKSAIAKRFLIVWLACVSAFTIMAIFDAARMLLSGQAALTTHTVLRAFGVPAVGVLLLAFGSGLVRVGWRFSAGDMRYLSNVIGRALTKK